MLRNTVLKPVIVGGIDGALWKIDLLVLVTFVHDD